jgi:DNA-binding transcriptional ArsR family regulator
VNREARSDDAIPADFLPRVAAQFKALSDPMRLAIMNALFHGQRSVGELTTIVGSSIANVSKHLSVLHHAGWVVRSKAGTTVHYALADRRAAQLCELMCQRVRERAKKEGEVAPKTAPARRARRRD